MEQGKSYTTTFVVEQTPDEVFNAINNVRGWWSEEIEGSTDKLGAEFRYHFQDVHRCKIKIVESISGNKVVWQVLDNYFSFTKDKSEWKGTRIVFEITKKGDKTEVHFTHLGLVPEYECYDVCYNAWGTYVNGSLRSLITTGIGKPNADQRPRTEAETNARIQDQGRKETTIMKNQYYAATFAVDQTPEEVFKAINNVRGWWSGEIKGDTDKLGAEFTYRVPDAHYSKQKITEFISGKKVVWRVLEADLSFVKDKSEWKGTDIVFEITKKGDKTEVRFAHIGLVPAYECYDSCSNAWGLLVKGNLRKLITTGKVQPSPW